MALWQGIALMVIRAIESSLGKNLQRYAKRPGRYNPTLNILGVLLKVLAGPMDAIAYNIAPQSTLAPFGMFLGLLLDFGVAKRVHGDAVDRRDIAAAVLIVAGTVLCLANGAVKNDGPSSVPTLGMLGTYAVCISAVVAMPFFAVVKLRHSSVGQADALAHAALGGILGSMTLVAGKLLIPALTAHDETWLTIALKVAVVGLVVPLHLYVLNRGFGRHSLVFLSPAQGALGLLANVTTGFCLYSEVPVAPMWFGLGVALLLAGVLVLCMKKAHTKSADGASAAAVSVEFVQAYGQLNGQRMVV